MSPAARLLIESRRDHAEMIALRIHRRRARGDVVVVERWPLFREIAAEHLGEAARAGRELDQASQVVT